LASLIMLWNLNAGLMWNYRVVEVTNCHMNLCLNLHKKEIQSVCVGYTQVRCLWLYKMMSL
jgi:hypothetical protein